MEENTFPFNFEFKLQETEQPPYEQFPFGVDISLQRFDEREGAFYSTRFVNEKMGGKNWRARQASVATRKMLNEIPGYSQLEYAFSEAAWTSYRPYDAAPLMAWVEAPGQRRPVEKELKKRGHQWTGSPQENSSHLKRAANFFGAAAVGITATNELWFYAADKEGLPIIFSPAHEHPVVTAEAKIIPTRLNRVIVMLVSQDRDLATFSPSPLAGAAVGQGYSHMAELASKTAAFIRGLGHEAIPMGNDTSLSVPLAIDAGLGEAGRHGMLLHPSYGSLVRICKVLTDLPLETDRSITFGAADYCRSCTICAEHCPAKAISFHRDTTFETVCPSNNRGIKKWPVNSWACLKFWVNNGKDCGICQAVCPFSRTSPVGLKKNDPLQWWHDQRSTT
ncbi:MAG TPA: reductive dehalogenase [Candidatus Limnocylindrales bacterium]|nr:reductive dehalogenase [Candidatus Limnocylindrales bacterium]